MNKSTIELERIKGAYARRKEAYPEDYYSLLRPGNLFIAQERERLTLELFRRHDLTNLREKRILDVGCGMGGMLRTLVNYGAQPGNLYGIDLLPERIQEAQNLSPNTNFLCGNAEQLPWPNETFDLIMQFTVFTSILQADMKAAIAREMMRVLKPQGFILWYDYLISKPTNRDVKGVGKGEIRSLFAGCRFSFHRTTLAPPLARRLAPLSLSLCSILSKVPPLCTHYLVLIQKESHHAP